jgi:predicted TIM-barrel enzyme
VFDTDQAADMARADVLVPHMGLTSSGTIGAQTTITLQDAALRVQGMHDAAKKVNRDSGAVDTCFSTATCIRRYRIKCPHADRLTVSAASWTRLWTSPWATTTG